MFDFCQVKWTYPSFNLQLTKINNSLRQNWLVQESYQKIFCIDKLCLREHIGFDYHKEFCCSENNQNLKASFEFLKPKKAGVKEDKSHVLRILLSQPIQFYWKYLHSTSRWKVIHKKTQIKFCSQVKQKNSIHLS